MNKKLAILWAILPLAFMLIFNSIKCLEFRSKLEHMNDTIPNLGKHCMYSTIMAIRGEYSEGASDRKAEREGLENKRKDSIFSSVIAKLKKDPDFEFGNSDIIKVYKQNDNRILLCRYGEYMSIGYMSYRNKGGAFLLKDSCKSFPGDYTSVLSCDAAFKKDGTPLIGYVIPMDCYEGEFCERYQVYDLKSKSDIYLHYEDTSEENESASGGDEESDDEGDDDEGDYRTVEYDRKFSFTSRYDGDYPVIVERRTKKETYRNTTTETDTSIYFRMDENENRYVEFNGDDDE